MSKLQSEPMTAAPKQLRRWKPRDRREGLALLAAILGAVVGSRLAIDWTQDEAWPIWATALVVLSVHCALYGPWYLWYRRRTAAAASA